MRYVSGVVILASLFLTSCGPGEKSPNMIPDPLERAIAVETLTVTEGFMNEFIEGSSTISGINEAFVVSETQGIITSVNFDLGDAVARDQILMTVDDKLQTVNLEQAEIEYENARLDFAATQKLFEVGGASLSELNLANIALSGAKAGYEATLKAYNDCTLRAPISGLIAQRDQAVALGNYVDPGTRVARIINTSALKLELAVGEEEIGLIDRGAAVEIFIPTCSRLENRGTVTAIAAGSDPATGSFAVVITWENRCPERVRAGMTAGVKIRTNETEPKLIVPSSAVVIRGGERVVYIAENGRAAERRVAEGAVLGNRTEIYSGLSGGEEIIISALSGMKSGQKVRTFNVGESGNRE